MMGIAFWMGLFWRRATVAGAWAATLTALGVWWLSSQGFFVSFVESLPFAQPLRLVWSSEAGPEIYLPWQMIFYLGAGFVSLIVVSLFTRPVAKEKLDRLYSCIRTPIKVGEPESAVPLTLPPGTEPAPRKVLINHPDFELSLIHI